MAVLRRGPLTVDEIVVELGLTDNAVRTQIVAMERDGLVRRAGMRRGPTRPATVFELTPELDQLLSHAYLPLLVQVVRTFAEDEDPEALDALMREAGRRLAREIAPRTKGPLKQRIAAASSALNSELGALTEPSFARGRPRIIGYGCPLSALTGKHPAVCHAIESFLEETLGTHVHECCEREGRPRCCFEIASR